MPKPAFKPAWILPNVLHVSKSRGQTMLLRTPPGLRASQRGSGLQNVQMALDVQVGVFTLMCLRPFVVCSGARDRKRRDCALDRPLRELLLGPYKLVMLSKTHLCPNWFTNSLSLLNC